MPRVEVKAEMHWEVWSLKPGKFCSGCRKRLGESAVMVTVLFPGLEPMPAKKYCQHCFDSMNRFWERHQLIQTVDAMQMQREETKRLNARIAELESQLRFYVGIAVDEARRQMSSYEVVFQDVPEHECLHQKVIKPVEVASTGRKESEQSKSKTCRD